MTISELKSREYWTPEEASRVLGRGRGFWRNAFDLARVQGYRCGRARHLNAESARAYLQALTVKRAAGPRLILTPAAKQALARFHSTHVPSLSQPAR